jgi:hypothetical protein
LDREDENTGVIVPGSWRQQSSHGSWRDITSENGHRCSDYASDVREEFCDYFSKEGAVPWQDAMLHEY